MSIYGRAVFNQVSTAVLTQQKLSETVSCAGPADVICSDFPLLKYE